MSSFALTSHRVTQGLLAGIFTALCLLIGILVFGRGPSAGSDRSTELAVRDGERVERSRLSNPPPAPSRPVGDLNRIRETLQEGKSYEVLLKMGVQSRVEDRAWGVHTVVNLTYVAELLVNRQIERNDGHRIVELRHFEACRNVKFLHDVEGVSLNLGLPQVVVLGALDYLAPGTGAAVLAAKPFAEAMWSKGTQIGLNAEGMKAAASVQNLSGKRVRITYLDGEGVTSLEPVGCSLSAQERDALMATAILSDCYILPDLRLKPGERWKVDAAQLIGFLDPSLQGIPSGAVTLVRGQDHVEDAETLTVLQIEQGLIELNRSDNSRYRVGTFSPKGILLYSQSESHIKSGHLTGEMTIEEVSKDHLLFETSFKSRPSVQIQYSCRIVNGN